MSGCRAVASWARPIPRLAVLRVSRRGLADAALGWRGVEDQSTARRCGKPGQGLGLRPRCRQRSTWTRPARARQDRLPASSAKTSDVVSHLAWDTPSVHPRVAMSKLVGVGGGCHASDGRILGKRIILASSKPWAHLRTGATLGS
jgi:hypothetical protein